MFVHYPEFPCKEGKNLTKTTFNLGNVPQTYDTTYSVDFQRWKPDSNESSINTAYLQKSHLNIGGYKSDMVSEMHDQYIPKKSPRIKEERNKATTQETTFVLGDPNLPFEKRKLEPVYNVRPPEKSNVSKNVRASHIILPNNEKEKWSTTTQDMMQYTPAEPVKPFDIDIRSGLGVYNSVHQSDFGGSRSISQDSYKKYDIPSLNLGNLKEIGRKGHLTTFNLGNYKNDYSTTTRSGAYPQNGCLPPPEELHYPASKTPRGSGIPLYSQFKIPTKTSYEEAHVAHPDFRPPEPSKLNQSTHYKLGGYPETWETTTKSDFVPHSARKPELMTKNLQKSDIGIPRLLGPKSSVYKEDFSKKDIPDRPDISQVRAFNTTSNFKDNYGNPKTGRTTYETDFQPAPPAFEPPEICSARGPSDIILRDPKTNIRLSEMKESFANKGPGLRYNVNNNELQRSHIRMFADKDTSYYTTSQDYFIFHSYRLPGK